MKIYRIRWIGLTALQLILLAGCASYPPPSRAYYVVPCSTPGAIPSETPSGAISAPLSSVQPDDAGSANSAAPVPPSAPAGAEPNSTDPVCVVAAGGRNYRYNYARGYGPGYYGPGYYSRPFYGSFGFSYFGGSHFGGGHHGVRHFSGRHFGGGHVGGGHFGGGHAGGGHVGGGHVGGHGH